MDHAYDAVTQLAEQARGKGDESKAIELEGKKLEQMIFQAPIGALEGLGVGGAPARWFKATPFGRAVQKGIGRYLFGGTREGLQESLQGALEDVSMRYGDVDETANPLDIKKRAREFAAGAVVGGPLEMVSSLAERSDKRALEAQRKIIRDDATAVIDGKHPGLDGLSNDEVTAARVRAREILQATESAERQEGLTNAERIAAIDSRIEKGGTAEAMRTLQTKREQLVNEAKQSQAAHEASQEIDGLQPNDRVAPEQLAPTQNVLRGLIKISQGQSLAALTAAERVAVMAKGPDGLPRVEVIQGKPVILDSTLARAREIAPATGRFLPADEQSQRQAILSPVAGAEGKTMASPGPEPGLTRAKAEPQRILTEAEDARTAALAQVLSERGVDIDESTRLAHKFVGENGAESSFVRQKFRLLDEVELSGAERTAVVETTAPAYEGTDGEEKTATEPGGEAVTGEARGIGTSGEASEGALVSQGAQTAEQAATGPELTGRTHVDDSINHAFEQRKSDFQRAGINQITESDEPFGAVGVRERADGSRELLVNRKIAREWFDKFGPDKARELIHAGIDEEYKHAIERLVARDNRTDTAALYRDWAQKNPDQEHILAEAYGEGWAKYSDTEKSAELARMILQTRESGQTTEQAFLGPDRAAAVTRALKQFQEPVRLTERLRQHIANVLEYLRGLKNPSKAILEHIRQVERFENELKTSEGGTLAMAKPARSRQDREQARIDGEKPPAQRFNDALPFAQRIASGYRNIPGIDLKDVEQHARIALARAAKAFDSERGIPFEAFARVAINNELRGLYRKQIKIPEQTTLDEPLSGEMSETRGSQLPDEISRSPADDAAYNEGIRALHEAIDALPAKMRTVVARLAAGDEPGDIARDLNIVKQGVSNLKLAALRRLRGKLGEKGITDIDDDGILRMAKPELDVREALNPLRTLGVAEGALNNGVVNAVKWLGRAIYAGGDAISANAAIRRATDAFSNSAPGAVVDAAIATMKTQFVSLGNVPTEAAAMIRERQTAEVYGSQVAIEWAKLLSGGGESQLLGLQVEPRLVTPENKRLLDQVIRGEVRVNALPEALRPAAKRVRKMIDDVGLDLVEAGLLNPTTYERNRGSYLARFYLPKEMEKLGFLGAGRRYYRLILDRFKPQLSSAYAVIDKNGNPVDWTKGQFRFENAAARDAWFDQFIGQKIVRDPELNRLAFELGFFGKRQDPQMTAADLAAFETLPAGLQRKIGDLREAITRKYQKIDPLSAEQLDRMGLIREPGYPVGKALLQMNHDLQLARLFNGIADRAEWVKNEEAQGFTKMPDSPRYGQLSSKWVQEDIARELQELGEVPSVAGQIYDSVLQTWKKWKTVYNPATHGRNLIGNVMFADFAGVNPLNPANWQHYLDAVKVLRGKHSEVTLEELYKHGVLGGDFGSQELQTALREPKRGHQS